MDSSARVTSKGQVTIPKAVRDALDLNEGDELLFRVEETRAVIARWQAARGYPTSGFLNKLQHKALLSEPVAMKTSSSESSDSSSRRRRRSSGGPPNPGKFLGNVVGGVVGGIFRR